MTDDDSETDTPKIPDGLLEGIESLAASADVTRVYGEPIESDGTTVVPVARVAYGFGGGGGEGAADEGRGYGGGGGASASPVGALEVDEDGARFVRFGSSSLVAGLALLAGLAIGVLLGRGTPEC